MRVHVWVCAHARRTFVFPWLLGIATVDHVGEVLKRAGSEVILEVMGLGALWGMGSLLFGLALERVGQVGAPPWAQARPVSLCLPKHEVAAAWPPPPQSLGTTHTIPSARPKACSRPGPLGDHDACLPS